MTTTALARAGYGAVLTIWPAVLIDLDGRTASKHTATVVRILGLRHLAQAAALTLSPTARHHRIGAAIDLAHALTGITCAALRPQHRKAASVDATVALSLAIANSLPVPMRQG